MERALNKPDEHRSEFSYWALPWVLFLQSVNKSTLATRALPPSFVAWPFKVDHIWFFTVVQWERSSCYILGVWKPVGHVDPMSSWCVVLIADCSSWLGLCAYKSLCACVCVCVRPFLCPPTHPSSHPSPHLIHHNLLSGLVLLYLIRTY